MKEMEFERGIWAAAMDGETGKVKRFLSNGVDPSCTDASGYTALVDPCSKHIIHFMIEQSKACLGCVIHDRK